MPPGKLNTKDGHTISVRRDANWLSIKIRLGTCLHDNIGGRPIVGRKGSFDEVLYLRLTHVVGDVRPGHGRMSAPQSTSDRNRFILSLLQI
jgi:hypothetical protein